jgi:hypothetical protein
MRNSIRTSQEIYYVSATKIEAIPIYCKNHTKHTNALCGQNAELKYVKAGGISHNGGGVHQLHKMLPE